MAGAGVGGERGFVDDVLLLPLEGVTFLDPDPWPFPDPSPCPPFSLPCLAMGMTLLALLSIELASTTSLSDIFTLTTSASRDAVVVKTAKPSKCLLMCSSIPVGSTK